ncbi:MAG TPA: cupin domain-containing protein [Terriglobales bacterium]
MTKRVVPGDVGFIPDGNRRWSMGHGLPQQAGSAHGINPVLLLCEEGVVMKGFVKDIESLAVKNDEFRRVLYTAKHCQLVVMALKPKEEIGAEVHKLDQFFRVEEGTGEAVLDGVRTVIRAGFAVVVPAGTNHNIINTGSAPLKLYTLYAPPNHRDGVVHHTRAEAEADNEHFDGKTTE